MPDQYDREKARVLRKFIFGSSRKAQDNQLASARDLVVNGGMSSALLQKLLADLVASRPLAKTDRERRAIDGAMADLVEGIMASGDVPGVAPTQDQPER